MNRAKEKKITMCNKAKDLSFCKQGHLLNKLSSDKRNYRISFVAFVTRRKRKEIVTRITARARGS